ncbi:putative dna helicase protein [Neofusicoccum parvum UCRNP2]|uniref:Putative dna helicase protein n=1 Tax=Botryosphaeria parva (strain UCR-NP2) TaxID=1287680 RepID=R1GAH3_BOTPV|nr:putative dna helicase protein [Neofusicoccum parvum UCRNP2]
MRTGCYASCSQTGAAGSRKGGSGKSKDELVERRFQEAARPIHCQRFFPSRHGSQYFEVRQPEQAQEEDQAHTAKEGGGEQLWRQAWNRANENWEELEKRARATIEDGEKDEVSPWLDRTQWLPYLARLDRDELLASVEEPNTTNNPDRPEEEEPVAAAIWKAMDDVARIGQQAVTQRVGIFIRMELMRTEKHQNRYHPLQPYMEENAVADRSRAWKQVLMFFREYDSALVCALAVQGVTPTGWREPGLYTAILSAIIKVGRFMVVQKALEMSGPAVAEEEGEDREEFSSRGSAWDFEEEEEEEEEEEDGAGGCGGGDTGSSSSSSQDSSSSQGGRSSSGQGGRSSSSQDSASSRTSSGQGSARDSSGRSKRSRCSQMKMSCLELVTKMMDSFIIRGSHSPMQWILDLRTYGMKIHYNTTTKGHVGWNGQEQLLYQGIQFTMAKFRGMVHGLLNDTRQLLLQELLFGHSHKKEHGEMDVPAVPWDSIRDNPAEERRGWSFLQDQRTRLPADGNTWLFNRIMGITAVRKRFTRKNTSSGISRQAVDAYAAQVAEFREKLLLLMHITGGQPARGPEILSIRHSNTAKGGHRNIFVEDGLVVFVTRYHKGYAMSGDVKVIHRYLPREVGELVVWYLWLVLPFHQRMLAVVRGSEQISAHMWPAEAGEKRWTTERMREAMKKESRIGLGQELTVRAYRDVAIGISRRFMRGSSAFRVDEEGGENGNEQEQQQMEA